MVMYRPIMVYDNIVHAHIKDDLAYIHELFLVRADFLLISGIRIEICHVFVPDKDYFSG